MAADPDQDRINTQVEALTRLRTVNLDEKPQIKAALLRALERTRGTPNFVRLVRHFNLTNENAGLMEVAMSAPGSELGVEAVRLVLANKDWATIQRFAGATNASNAANAVTALGNAREKQAVPLLEKIASDVSAGIDVRRAAVVGLSQTEEGAAALLGMARNEKLPDNLQFTAASALNSVPWGKVKNEAAKILPLPAAKNNERLPPVSELVRKTGDPAKGAEVFRRESSACIQCHQVGTDGKDVGPALTEIGTKLAREALYESILDPNSGISFGYEPFQLELNSGDEAYGLKVSETPDEIAIKDTAGLVTRYKKADVKSIRQGSTSIMPAGLQQAMSIDDLVNLIEYLASLRKNTP